MSNRNSLLVGVLAALSLAVLMLALRPGHGPIRPKSGTAAPSNDGSIPSTATQRDLRKQFRASSTAPGGASVGTPVDAKAQTPLERVTRLLVGDGDVEETALSREALEQWLASGRTNAADLLAARQAGGGAEMLRRALEQFPNDPRVLLQTTSLEDDPAARRERLDRLKAVAPDNSLADYLSARDHLANGRVNEALADLRAASSKKGFEDYVTEAALNGEELYLRSGSSPVEAKALGTSTVLVPHLSELKHLVQDLGSLQQRYLDAGDRASAEALANMGLKLGQRLGDQGSPHPLIHDVIGSSIELLALRQLPPDSTPDFLGQTVRQYLQERQARHDYLKESLGKPFGDWLAQANEADVISYFDRMKSQGEVAALEWLRNRQGKRP